MQFIRTGPNAIAETATSLTANWQLLACDPGRYGSPAELENQTNWLPAVVPGTVAQALQQAGQWHLNQVEDFDAKDWWYTCTFTADVENKADAYVLHFNGLATLADVWLNGECILNSANMFVAHQLNVSRLLRATNALAIRFRALNPVLSEKRPRPRWKTKLVQHQNLRWLRTTLLGRIPGWSPPIAPVGPWRGIVLEHRAACAINEIGLRPLLVDGQGVVDFSCSVKLTGTQRVRSARLCVGNAETGLKIESDQAVCHLAGQLRIQNPDVWWPHTHGTPALYPCKLIVELQQQTLTLDCGEVGFKSVAVEQSNGDFKLIINGEPVFCRGACWTVNDIVSIAGTHSELQRSLELARDAGMNMLRVGGTMVYESEAFYALCDRMGILVWQDFMFANMDYPIEDAQFAEAVTQEITQQLQRWQAHPCITVYCGNSEIEQQAAMLGMPEASWRSSLFAKLVPELCEIWHPGIPYVPSTPTGGTLPFHVGTGITHYYGVGAYLRPVSEVRRAQVRFTPECLGFANVPEDTTLNQLFEGQLPVCHHPLWKSRVPRDTGTGWDFEDVRDHYLKTLWQKDPVELRCYDMPRYLALSRLTTGEMMEQVFSEWRSTYSRCGGALVWFYKDLWPGAGWGILDSTSTPKAVYRYLQRVWQPQTLVLTDEGLDGVHVHVLNETAQPLTGRVEFVLLRDDRIVVARAEKALTIAPRTTQTYGSDELLKGFYDVAYIYRFGPPKHHTVIATLLDAAGNRIAEAFYFPGARKTDYHSQVNFTAEAAALANGDYVLTLETDTLLQGVHFDLKGLYASDEYFHLAPGRRQVHLHKQADAVTKFRGYVESVSLVEPISIKLKA